MPVLWLPHSGTVPRQLWSTSALWGADLRRKWWTALRFWGLASSRLRLNSSRAQDFSAWVRNLRADQNSHINPAPCGACECVCARVWVCVHAFSTGTKTQSRWPWHWWLSIHQGWDYGAVLAPSAHPFLTCCGSPIMNTLVILGLDPATCDPQDLSQVT